MNIEVKTEDGVVILLEQPGASVIKKAGGKKISSISETFERLLSPMLGCAKTFSNKVKEVSEIPGGPKSASVEFGLTLDLEGNLAVAKVGSESHFKITLAWDVDQASPG